MEHAFFARAQMGMSLGFHIIFASIGITMPILMVISEFLWLKTGEKTYLTLTKAWAKGTAVFFAIGAVSGTVLAFELGLLFPTFMLHAGPLIGLPFSLEGFAFFTEAIFLGIYLYGWDRVSPKKHLFAGIIVALSGSASAMFVTTANAWMNVPRGFRVEMGRLVDIDPIAAMLSPFVWHEVPHTLLASFMATAFAVAAIHAYILLKNPGNAFHRRALVIALALGAPCAIVQPFVGHFAGQQVAKYQPLKFAAMESQLKTERRAPLKAGGIEIPGLLSFFATNDFDGEVKGLEEFPEADWPSSLVHYCFQIMVALGFFLSAVAAVFLLRRKRVIEAKAFLWAVVLAGPMGYIATEAGWIVTEVGRQPWVIYNFLRTADSITPVQGLLPRIFVFALIYAVLGSVTVLILRKYVKASPGTAKELQ